MLPGTSKHVNTNLQPGKSKHVNTNLQPGKSKHVNTNLQPGTSKQPVLSNYQVCLFSSFSITLISVVIFLST